MENQTLNEGNEMLSAIPELSAKIVELSTVYKAICVEKIKQGLMEMPKSTKVSTATTDESPTDLELELIVSGCIPTFIWIFDSKGGTVEYWDTSKKIPTFTQTPNISKLKHKQEYRVVAFKENPKINKEQCGKVTFTFDQNKHAKILVYVMSQGAKDKEQNGQQKAAAEQTELALARQKVRDAIGNWHKAANGKTNIPFDQIEGGLYDVMNESIPVEDLNFWQDAGFKALTFMTAKAAEPVAKAGVNFLAKGLTLVSLLKTTATGSPLGFVIACAFDVTIGKLADNYQNPLKDELAKQAKLTIEMRGKAVNVVVAKIKQKRLDVDNLIIDTSTKFQQQVDLINTLEELAVLKNWFEQATKDIGKGDKVFNFSADDVKMAVASELLPRVLGIDISAKTLPKTPPTGDISSFLQKTFTEIGLQEAAAKLYEPQLLQAYEHLKAGTELPGIGKVNAELLKLYFLANCSEYTIVLSDKKQVADLKKLQSFVSTTTSTDTIFTDEQANKMFKKSFEIDSKISIKFKIKDIVFDGDVNDWLNYDFHKVKVISLNWSFSMVYEDEKYREKTTKAVIVNGQKQW